MIPERLGKYAANSITAAMARRFAELLAERASYMDAVWVGNQPSGWLSPLAPVPKGPNQKRAILVVFSSGLSVSARAIHRRSIGSEAEQRASAGCQGLSVLKGRACAGSRGLYRTRGSTVSPWVADWLSSRCHVTAGVCDVADRENCNPDQGFGLRLSDLQRLSDN